MRRPIRQAGRASAATLLAIALVVVAAACTTTSDRQAVDSRAPSAPASGRPSPTSMPPTASMSEPGEPAAAAPRFLPAVGSCLDARKDAVPGAETIVPCDAEHDDEVYDAFDLAGEVHPGDDATAAAARAGCVDRFAGFVGIPFEASVLDVVALHPTGAEWAAGDRRVLCLVYDPADTVVGSLVGAAR